MSKSKCEFCKKQLRSGEWMLIKGEDDTKAMKVCIDRKACSQRCIAKGKGLLSLGLHKDVR